MANGQAEMCVACSFRLGCMKQKNQNYPPPFPATALLPGLDEPDWTEIELSGGIPTSGLYLQLTVIWMQLMVSSRSTKSELFWVWALSALDSEGVVLWRLTATAGPVCQILMWHTRLSYPQHENSGEREIGSVTTWLEGLRWNVRTVCWS